MKKSKYLILFFLVFSGLLLSHKQVLAASLDGRILLQVQDKGQAWYVNPLDSQRYYLGRPEDAFRIMRDLGLGVSNQDLQNFLNNNAPARLAGRILLQVQDKGQAYYINPLSLRLHYLGKPADAFAVIRALGLGITNSDLQKITIGYNSDNQPSLDVSGLVNINFPFKYRKNNFNIALNLSEDLYTSYSNSPKIFTYFSDNPPDNLHEAFYEMFLNLKTGDNSVNDIVNSVQLIAAERGWYGDWVAELALAFIQYIPYDNVKAESGLNNPFYPYETLYLNKGVCSDKTFLAYVVLNKLGYGTAIMDFPDINHSTVGIACPVEHSISGSGYCYAETTNYFPIGIIPGSIDGQAKVDAYDFTNLFDESKLGKIEIFNKLPGTKYQQVKVTKEHVAELQQLYQELEATRDKLNNDYELINEFNKKVELFNNKLSDLYQR